MNTHRHKDLTAEDLAQNVTTATGKSISRPTAYRRLAENPVYARRMYVSLLGITEKSSSFMEPRTRVLGKSRGSVATQRYEDEVLELHVRLFRGANGKDFILKDDNAKPNRANFVKDFHE
ncbi:hypothetical protein TNCV_323291 [Trichonephila clavipes]|nr:hypothetical protein TNCV_323291 [Trichonephila clavipes]